MLSYLKKVFSRGSAVPYFEFMGYRIPVHLLEKTGGGPSTFAAIAEGHIRNLKKHVGLAPNMDVLEIGCGIGRDAIPLTKVLDRSKKYVGIDVIGESIEWCKSNISRANPNFHFIHLDIEDKLHNGGGTRDLLVTPLPIESSAFDMVFLQSVFTHMLAPGVRHYLSEFKRVLRPGGRAYITLFAYSDDILQSARATNLTQYDLRFEHEVESGVRINNLEFPTGAVAFSESKIRELVAESGLKWDGKIIRGSWSGLFKDCDDGQDRIILTR